MWYFFINSRIWRAADCLCPLIRFDWALLLAQDIRHWHSDMRLRRLGLDTGTRDREAETQQTLPGLGAAFQPGPGARLRAVSQSSAKLRRKFPFLCLPRFWRLSLVTVTDCREQNIFWPGSGVCSEVRNAPSFGIPSQLKPSQAMLDCTLHTWWKCKS